MNGGVFHAIDSLDRTAVSNAIEAYRYLGLHAVSDLIAEGLNDFDSDGVSSQREEELDDAYHATIPDDGAVGAAFRAVLAARPDEFAPGPFTPSPRMAALDEHMSRFMSGIAPTVAIVYQGGPNDGLDDHLHDPAPGSVGVIVERNGVRHAYERVYHHSGRTDDRGFLTYEWRGPDGL